VDVEEEELRMALGKRKKKARLAPGERPCKVGRGNP